MAKEIGTSRFDFKEHISIPKGVIEKLNLLQGDKIVFIEDNGVITIQKVTAEQKTKGDLEREVEQAREAISLERFNDMKYWG